MSVKRGEKPAIVPSDSTPVRKQPMTEEEFAAFLAKERREIEAAGRPLSDPGWRHRRAAITLESR